MPKQNDGTWVEKHQRFLFNIYKRFFYFCHVFLRFFSVFYFFLERFFYIYGVKCFQAENCDFLVRLSYRPLSVRIS